MDFYTPLPLVRLLKIRHKALAATDEKAIQAAKKQLDAQLAQCTKTVLASCQSELAKLVALRIHGKMKQSTPHAPPLSNTLKLALAADIKDNVHLVPREYKHVSGYARDLTRNYGQFSRDDVIKWFKDQTPEDFHDFAGQHVLGEPTPILSIPVLLCGRQLPTPLHKNVCHYLTPEDLLLGLAPVSRNWLDWTWTKFPFLIVTLPMFGRRADHKRQRFLIELLQPVLQQTTFRTELKGNKKRRVTVVQQHTERVHINRMDVTGSALAILKRAKIRHLTSVRCLAIHPEHEKRVSKEFAMGPAIQQIFPDVERIIMYQNQVDMKRKVIYDQSLRYGAKDEWKQHSHLSSTYDFMYDIQLGIMLPVKPQNVLRAVFAHVVCELTRLHHVVIIGDQVGQRDLMALLPPRTLQTRPPPITVTLMRHAGCKRNFSERRTMKFIRWITEHKRARTLHIACQPSCQSPPLILNLEQPLDWGQIVSTFH